MPGVVPGGDAAVKRPVTARARYHALGADAFLVAGALFLVLAGLLGLLFGRPSVGSQVISQVVTFGSILAGTRVALGLHGHVVRGSTWLAILVGAVGGAVVAIPVVLGLFLLGRVLPSPVPDQEAPWGGILMLAAVSAAFLAAPVARAVRDLARRSGDLRLATVRLGALALVLVVIAATSLMAGATTEAAIFMVPVAAASAVAVAGVAWFEGWRSRRDSRPPGS